MLTRASPTAYQLGLERLTEAGWTLEPSRFTTIAGAALHLLCRCQEDQIQRRVVILDAARVRSSHPTGDHHQDPAWVLCGACEDTRAPGPHLGLHTWEPLPLSVIREHGSRLLG